MPRASNGSTLTPSLEGVDVSKLRILSVEDILAADDVKYDIIPTPEWGGAVRIKGLTKAQEFLIREQAGGAENMDMEVFEMLMFIHGCVEPEFQPEHIELLKAKSAAPFDRVLEAVMKLSGLTKEARDKAKTTFPAKT